MAILASRTLRFSTFSTRLGWACLAGAGQTVYQLAIAHATAKAAWLALDRDLRADAAEGAWNASLVRRLQAYCEGAIDEFLDVPIDCGPLTPFQRRVIDLCRRIPYGQTIRYAELAAKAGARGAARAVGNCMARNRIPLIVPCHRVVGSSGLGGYSAPGGIETKCRLLELEKSPRRRSAPASPY